MADERYLVPIRRFWATEEVVRENYEKIFSASSQRLEKVTVIIGNGTEADSVSGQVVLPREDYDQCMEACEATDDRGAPTQGR